MGPGQGSSGEGGKGDRKTGFGRTLMFLGGLKQVFFLGLKKNVMGESIFFGNKNNIILKRSNFFFGRWGAFFYYFFQKYFCGNFFLEVQHFF